jgi:hypothetical protein
MGDAMKGGLGENSRGTIFEWRRSGVLGQDMVREKDYGVRSDRRSSRLEYESMRQEEGREA